MMNAQRIIGKLQSNGGVTHGAVFQCAKMILLVVLFCLVSQPALAAGVKNCSKQAKAAFKACKSEVKDDFFIAVGNCYNLPTKEETKECIQDAKEEQQEAKEECEDQLDARMDLCDALGEEPYNPDIGSMTFVDPADIGGAVAANPWFPLVSGNMWTYKTRENGVVTETITVEVLAGETIEIEGVTCAVVRDIVYEGDVIDPDNIIEDTYDWYAQQDDGTVWYFGEFSLSKEDCEPEELCEELYTEDGSWKSGYEGGKAGIIMFGDPSVEVGTVFRQEIALGDAEDAGEVISFNEESVTVPLGTYNTDVVKTLDFSPLEPDDTENKYYAPGVGVIKEEALADGVLTEEFVELVSKNF